MGARASEKEKEKEKEKERERERERAKAKAKAAAQKNKSPSKSRSRNRSSPSVQRHRSSSSSRSSKSSKESGDATRPTTAQDGEDFNGDAPKRGELKTITLAERPFGMAASKEPGVSGYVVAKIAEGKPAAKANVELGWKVVKVGNTDCEDSDMDAVQALLKNCSVPVKVTFEQPLPDDFDAEDEEEEFDVSRADLREKHSSAMATIDDLPVKRDPDDLPPPISSWSDACTKGLLNKPLTNKLVQAGLRRPTLIQRHTIPIIGHQSGAYDMVALAQTGSGKTFAFVIPTVSRLLLEGVNPRPFFPGKSPGSPLILLLSPTRELAMQTSKEIEVLAKGTKLSTVVVYGGETLKFQQQRIEKSQMDILCATPGRLIDLIDNGAISLSFIQSVVFDEADQMLEQSLEVMCMEILTGRDMPNPEDGRQTLLFSATMPQKIRDMCPQILRTKSLANITIGNYGRDHGGSCASIQQILKYVPDEHHRQHVLVDDLKRYWLGTGKTGRVVIFTNQRVQAGFLAKHLETQGFAVVHLHGKLDQATREEVFNSFRNGDSDILVATNVASRGLDFPDISFVVQYNLPNEIDIYTHRIGRTGRVGQVGCALGYMGPRDRHLAPRLIDFLELNKQQVPDFLRYATRTVSPPRRRYGR